MLRPFLSKYAHINQVFRKIKKASIYAGWKDFMQGLESKKYWC